MTFIDVDVYIGRGRCVSQLMTFIDVDICIQRAGGVGEEGYTESKSCFNENPGLNSRCPVAKLPWSEILQMQSDV